MDRPAFCPACGDPVPPGATACPRCGCRHARGLDRLVPCPHCGEFVDEEAEFCRSCGSDDETGWASEDEVIQAIEIPEYLPEDVGAEPRASHGPLWAAVAIVVLVAFLVWVLGR